MSVDWKVKLAVALEDYKLPESWEWWESDGFKIIPEYDIITGGVLPKYQVGVKKYLKNDTVLSGGWPVSEETKPDELMKLISGAILQCDAAYAIEQIEDKKIEMETGKAQ